MTHLAAMVASLGTTMAVRTTSSASSSASASSATPSSTSGFYGFELRHNVFVFVAVSDANIELLEFDNYVGDVVVKTSRSALEKDRDGDELALSTIVVCGTKMKVFDRQKGKYASCFAMVVEKRT